MDQTIPPKPKKCRFDHSYSNPSTSHTNSLLMQPSLITTSSPPQQPSLSQTYAPGLRPTPNQTSPSPVQPFHISTSTQTSTDLLSNPNIGKELCEVYKQLLIAKDTIKKQRTQIRFLKSKKALKPLIESKLLKAGMTANMASLYTRNGKFTRKIQRKDVCVGTVIRAISPKAYRYLRRSKVVRLPSESTLRRWLPAFKIQPGIRVQLLEMVRNKLTEEADHECFLAFDEMALKERWVYDKVRYYYIRVQLLSLFF